MISKKRYFLFFFCVILTGSIVMSTLIPLTSYQQPKESAQGVKEVQPLAKLETYDAAQPYEWNITCDYEPSENFTIHVRVVNITLLKGGALNLTWDPDLKEVKDIRFGAFWGTPGLDYIGIAGTIDPVMGTLSAPWGASRLKPPLNGTGIIYEIDFHVLKYLEPSDDPWIKFGNITQLFNPGAELIICPYNDILEGCPAPPPPHGPPANFTYSPPSPLVGQTVTFDASGSLPGFNGTHDMLIVSYAWDFGDGTPIVTEADPITTHSYTAAGDYPAILNVTDSQGLWNTTSKIITVVQPPAYGPTAVFTYSPLAPLTNEVVTFNASASLPGFNGTHDTPIVSYAWSFGDGSPIVIEYDPVITYGYTAAGDYPAILNVTDSQGLWNTTSKIITVTAPLAKLETYDAAQPYEWNITCDYEPCENFTIHVRVVNITLLKGGALNLTWDPDLKEVTAVRFGPFWGTTGVDYLGIAGTIDKVAGTLTAPWGVSRLKPPLNGTGVIFEIDFHVLKYLELGDDPWIRFGNLTQLFGPGGEPITYSYNDVLEGCPPPVRPVAPVRVYLEPSTLTATAVGQSFTVEIRIDNVTDLFALQTGLMWDPNLLEVNISGPHGGFAFSSVWGTLGSDYIGFKGEINNITGEIYPPCGATRTTTGINGVGLILAYIDFVAKAAGTSNIHLAEVMLLDSKEKEIPTSIIDVFTVIVEENPPFHVITVHNLTGSPLPPLRLRLTNHTFSQENKKISFNITGPLGTVVFWNVTIPKSLLDKNETHYWVIYLDGVNITGSVTIYENATHTSFYFAFNRTLYTHKIEIQGSWVVPEFPLAMILPLLIIVTLAIALLRKTVQPTKRKIPTNPPRH